VETNGAAQFAALPSLHVAWALWAAIALSAVVRRPLLRAALWLYPIATVTDVLATANHFLLDVITAPGLVLLGYAVALTPALARQLRRRQLMPRLTGNPGAQRRLAGRARARSDDAHSPDRR
jgi:hypothetical protein